MDTNEEYKFTGTVNSCVFLVVTDERGIDLTFIFGLCPSLCVLFYCKNAK